jgi:hypothetical protein
MFGATHTLLHVPQLLLSVVVFAQYAVAGFGGGSPEGQSVWTLEHAGPHTPLVHEFPLVHMCPHAASGVVPQLLLSFRMFAQ